MRPIMLKWVAKIAKATGLPISATSGIATWEDVIKATMCGATTIQTCTAMMYGPRQYGEIKVFLDGITKYLKDRNIPSINDIRGKTLPQILTWDIVDRENKAVSIVDESKCIGCGMCPKWCFFDAIKIETIDGKKKAVISKELCDGCGLCAALCQSNALKMEGPVPVYMGNFA